MATVETEIYTVKTDQFEGPIELLLSLIEKRKLAINSVSLSAVTEDYLKILQNSTFASMQHTTHFVYIASVLILIKSRSLLPTIHITDQEQEDIEDLERRLEHYQHIQHLARDIVTMFDATPLFARKQRLRRVTFSPGRNLDLDAIQTAVGEVLAMAPKPEPVTEARMRPVVHLEELVQSITDRIRDAGSTNFSHITRHNARTYENREEEREHRVYVVVGFLALLEMVRGGIVAIAQEEAFEDIVIEAKRE